ATTASAPRAPENSAAVSAVMTSPGNVTHARQEITPAETPRDREREGLRALKTLNPRSPGRSPPPAAACAFVRFAQRIAGGRAGEAALRRDGQPVEIDVARRLVGAPLEVVHPLQRRRLAADEAEHHALVLRHEAQRLEIARARRVFSTASCSRT